MRNIKLAIAGFMIGFLCSQVMSATPVWTFTADTDFPPTASVQFNTSAIVKYTMTNQSKRAHTLKLSPIPGVRQIQVGSNVCKSPFKLDYQQSCTLILLIKGSGISKSFTGGPEVCEQGSDLQCYQPDEKSILKITKVEVEDATITADPMTLILTATSQTPGTITVNNTSDVSVTNVQAILPSAWTDVTQNSSQCQSVAPHQSCELLFTPGNTTYTNQIIPITSENASNMFVTMGVVAPNTAIITGEPLDFTLIQDGSASAMTITNTSSIVTATNIQANLPADCSIQQTSNCNSVLPGSSCQITFTPSSSTCSAQSFTVAGTNTSELTGQISVMSSTASISSTPSSIILTVGETTPTAVKVTNESSVITATHIQASWSDCSGVEQDASDCSDVEPGGSCEILFTPGSSTCSNQSVTIQGTNTSSSSLSLTVEPPVVTTLSSSVSELALSVKNTSLNAALIGTPRTITLTNTGIITATDVQYSLSPSLPSGTTVSPSSCGSIAPNETCVITVTPGSTPSAAAGNKTPTPITMLIQGSNTNTVTVSLNILTYGSVYQSGYLFSVDDTTSPELSIGGKVIGLSAQAPTYASGINWSSNSSGSYVFDDVPGIYETSTASSTSCDGSIDGACNSRLILNYYLTIPTEYYAAGKCAAAIDGYSDWYLPALCELGYSKGSDSTVCGTETSPAIQNVESNLVQNGNIGNFQNFYTWSSTELASSPQSYGWAYFLGNYPASLGKNSHFGVYCVRALT